MIEFIKHALGFCGEHWHPNIWTILAGSIGLTPAFYYIKSKLKQNVYTNRSQIDKSS